LENNKVGRLMKKDGRGVHVDWVCTQSALGGRVEGGEEICVCMRAGDREGRMAQGREESRD
jgi:hypothetical protein